VADVEDRVAAVTARYDGPDNEAARLTADALRRLEWRRRRGGKVCPACGEAKPVSAFGPRTDAPDGLRSACRPCEAARVRAQRRALPVMPDYEDEGDGLAWVPVSSDPGPLL
jgi:hypothetical protein